VKKRGLHIVVFVVLSSALLFNQVGLNFFHDRHEAHEYFAASQKNQSMLLNHGEHCQVCSLEVLFNVVLPVSTGIPTQVFISGYNQEPAPASVFIFFDRPCGRAPPAA
jgi:hypothetical protein